ncbi:MAG: sporulation protein, partial [Clostridiales bacterium]|nr:sporulation protein [Clostridiales bacterium]
HILSAVLCGILLKRGNNRDSRGNLSFSPIGFSAAFTESIKRATASMVTVCGFVVFFSVLVGVLDASGVLLSLSGGISSYSGTELHFSRSLLTGILEIGTGISSMLGLSANAQNAALCSFLIGWGGLSVHAQAAAVIREGGLNPARHTFGKLLHGCLSALITFFTYPIIF